MRYLTENNEYVIFYSKPIPPCFNSKFPYIFAYLIDKKTKQTFDDHEDYDGNLEKCVMKLGKRLIKTWQNLKK